jgi:hypothetical protein
MRTILAIAAALILAAPAAALEPDAVRAGIESRFPVEVLRLDPAEHDGRAVYVATVMVRAGDYNDALSVSRLMVDAASGALVPQTAAALAGIAPDHRPGREGMERMRD